MTLSIIIPVYNVAQYLPACINSVLNNDTSDCEILLVDDGATDGSGEICDEFASRHPSLIRVIHQANGGLGAARNAGIEASTGAWLLFLDSDDTLTPEALGVLKAVSRKQRVQVIGFQFCSDDGAGGLSPGPMRFPPTDRPFTLQEQPQYLLELPAAPLRLWHRSLFVGSGIRFPSRVWYEDIRTTTKLLSLASGIIVLPDRLYHYLQRPGSIMSNQDLERNREILEAFDDLLGWYQAQGLQERYAKELCALTVEHVLLAASVRVARADPRHPLLEDLRAYTDKTFPQWPHDPYLRALPKPKLLALWLIKGRHYKTLSQLFRLKG